MTKVLIGCGPVETILTGMGTSPGHPRHVLWCTPTGIDPVLERTPVVIVFLQLPTGTGGMVLMAGMRNFAKIDSSSFAKKQSKKRDELCYKFDASKIYRVLALF